MTTLPAPATLAAHLVALVREDIDADPARFASCASWRSLHDVVDANEYVIDAMAELGLDADVDDDHLDLYGKAERLAETDLWGGQTIHATPAAALHEADAMWAAANAAVAKRAVRVAITANGERVAYAMWAKVDGRHVEVGRIGVRREGAGWVVE